MGVLQERGTHEAIATALEQGVDNRDFFVWVRLDGHPDVDRLPELVELAEGWLASLDPDTGSGNEAPLRWETADGTVELTALAKKPRARGDDPLVGNPYPAFAYWTR